MMLHPKMRHVYIGCDIHKHQHTAVIINCFSEKLAELTFPNKKQNFPKLLSLVKKHTPQGITPVFGLEDVLGNGRELAMFLLEKNHKVKYVSIIKSLIEPGKYAIKVLSYTFSVLTLQDYF